MERALSTVPVFIRYGLTVFHFSNQTNRLSLWILILFVVTDPTNFEFFVFNLKA